MSTIVVVYYNATPEAVYFCSQNKWRTTLITGEIYTPKFFCFNLGLKPEKSFSLNISKIYKSTQSFHLRFTT